MKSAALSSAAVEQLFQLACAEAKTVSGRFTAQQSVVDEGGGGGGGQVKHLFLTAQNQ